jgi:hypothetical protein
MRSQFRGLVVVACLLLACQGSPSSTPTPDDGGVIDAGMPPVTVGLLQDCSPEGAGYGDILCAAGLRCSIVLVGDTAAPGALSQCVPLPTQALKEGQPCAFDRELKSPTEPTKHFDSCGPGLGCVPTPSHGLQCQRLCQLRRRSTCGKTELCVMPSQVSGLGFCMPPEPCHAVTPQSGCPLGDGGKQLACYVLADDKGTGAFCLAQQPYGVGMGALDTPCERSWHCQPGLSCVTVSEDRPVCRPYCSLPAVPDGGMPPDLGGGPSLCPPNQGTCHAITDYESVGRCF